MCGGNRSISTKTLKCLLKRNNLESKHLVSSYDIQFPHIMGLSSSPYDVRVRRKLRKHTPSSTKMVVICLHFVHIVNIVYHMITGCDHNLGTLPKLYQDMSIYQLCTALKFKVTSLFRIGSKMYNVAFLGIYRHTVNITPLVQCINRCLKICRVICNENDILCVKQHTRSLSMSTPLPKDFIFSAISFINRVNSKGICNSKHDNDCGLCVSPE